MAGENNPFFVKPPNVFESLLAGEQGFKSARDSRRQSTLEDARLRAGQAIQSGGDLRQAMGELVSIGDNQGVAALGALSKQGLTDEIKEYQLAKSQGFGGSFFDFKTSLKKAGATNVNVNTGEKEYDKTLSKGFAESFLNTQKQGRGAESAIGTLNLMEKLTSDPNFYSGSGGEAVTQLKRAASSIGISAPDAAGPNELFRSMGNRLVLDAAGGSLGTGFSNADRDFIQSTVPALANTPEGNRQIIQVQRKVYERQREVSKLAREYAKNNGGRVDAGFEATLAQWAERNPLFPRQAAPAPGGGNRTGTGVPWRIVQ